jgi:hypothetical protein
MKRQELIVVIGSRLLWPRKMGALGSTGRGARVPRWQEIEMNPRHGTPSFDHLVGADE